MASNTYSWEELRIRLEVKIAECIKEILSKDDEVSKYVKEAVLETDPTERSKKMLFICTFIKSVFNEIAKNNDIEDYTEDKMLSKIMQYSYSVTNAEFVKHLKKCLLKGDWVIINGNFAVGISIKASEAGRIRIEGDCAVSFEKVEDNSDLYNIKVNIINTARRRK